MAAHRSGTCSRRRSTEAGYTDALKAERTIEAEGRLENLEELVSVAREYDAQADEPFGRGVPPADRALLGAGQPHRRGGHRHADDAPQRQGARVPGRVHARHGGRRLPAHALDRGGRHRGGAAALLRRDRPARCATSTSRTRARARCTAGASGTCRAGSSRRFPAELTDQEDAGAPSITSWSEGGAGAGAPAAAQRGRHVQRRRRRRARGLRRGRRDRRRARGRRGGALPRRRLRAQADGGLRAAEEGMSARVIEGKPVSERVREGVRQEVEHWVAEPAMRRPGSPRSSWATTRRPRSTCATSARRARRRACARSITSSPPTPARTRWPRYREAERGRRGARHPAPAARPAADRRRRDDRSDRPAQGRGRPHPDQRRPAVPGPRGARAVHPVRRDGAAARGGRRAEGRRGGRRRPLEARRQARRPAPAGRGTPPSRLPTRARATWPRCAGAPTCSSRRSACRAS